MNKKTALKISIPVFMSFYVMGFVDLVGVATGYIQKDFQLTDSVAQLLPMMVFLWFALIAIPTGIFQDRKGKKYTVNLGMLLTGVGTIIPFVYYSYITAIIGFMILGIGNTILQVSANPLLIDISKEGSKAANLSLSQFVKAIASMLGPAITAFVASYFGDWKLIFPIYTALSLLVVFWLRSVHVEERKPEKEPATFKSAFRLLKNPFILAMVFGIFLIVGFDVSMNSNITNFLRDRFAIDIDSAALGISVYFASLMAGRISGTFLLRIIKPESFLVVSSIITLAGLAGIILAPTSAVAFVMIFIAGLGFANIFPIFFAIIVEHTPKYANELSGLIILAVSGGAVIPPIMGLLSQHFGVTASIFVLVACILYVGYATLLAVKQSKAKAA
ncbi:MAG: MFS transporter [Bacteroidales bacterium]|nr:MFS transporter [Bacteroidales bacterium]